MKNENINTVTPRKKALISYSNVNTWKDFMALPTDKKKLAQNKTDAKANGFDDFDELIEFRKISKKILKMTGGYKTMEDMKNATPEELEKVRNKAAKALRLPLF